MHADSWIGSDVSILVTVRITEMSKADKEGRTYRGKALPLDNEAAQSAGRALSRHGNQPFCAAYIIRYVLQLYIMCIAFLYGNQPGFDYIPSYTGTMLSQTPLECFKN